MDYSSTFWGLSRNEKVNNNRAISYVNKTTGGKQAILKLYGGIFVFRSMQGLDSRMQGLCKDGNVQPSIAFSYHYANKENMSILLWNLQQVRTRVDHEYDHRKRLSQWHSFMLFIPSSYESFFSSFGRCLSSRKIRRLYDEIPLGISILGQPISK